MKISHRWLHDFVPCDDLSRDAFTDLLTTKVAEVEGVFEVGSPIAKAIVGAIRKVERHPSREKLHVVTVALGSDEVTVVCGAPRCEVGMLVPYVPPGSIVLSPNGEEVITVAERDVAGVLSRGVLASEAELGLTGDHSGLLVLSELPEGRNARPGMLLSEIVGGPDLIVEIDNKSLTHRPDLWSHFGFARELSAILGRPLTLDADRYADDRPEGGKLLTALGTGTSRFETAVAPGSRCRRFSALEFAGVRAAPSPLWMRRRLASVGAGIRNLLVDLSNYVMHDIGQPNHAYDADLLHGTRLTARPAVERERFLGLDGIERELTADDVVIADADRAVALAGVIGGAETAVNDQTGRLLLECANFDPVQIRLTTKRHGVRTDASNRFEKSRSPYATPLALHRFRDLLLAAQTDARVVGAALDAFPERPPIVTVPARYSTIRDRIDPAVSNEIISGILSSLGFGLSGNGTAGDAFEVTVPYERATRDVSIEEDLVEEVGRIYGYERVAELAPHIESTARPDLPLLALENAIRDRLVGGGFSEAYLYSFADERLTTKCGYSLERAVRLQNPIDADRSIIRVSLVPGLLELIERNARYSDEMFLFEFGRAYEHPSDRDRSAVRERRLLGLIGRHSGDEAVLGAAASPPITTGFNFYAMQAVVRRIVRLVTGDPVHFRPCASSALSTDAPAMINYETAPILGWMHPARAAAAVVRGEVIGVIAEARTDLGCDVPARSVIGELDVEALLSLREGPERFHPLPRFPSSFFDMSIVMPEREPYERLEKLLRDSVEPEFMRGIEVFSLYRGKPLEDGEKSVSVRLVLGAEDRTLSTEEVSAMQGRLMAAINESAYSLRS